MAKWWENAKILTMNPDKSAQYPTQPNPLLTVGANNRVSWLEPENRRYGFHHLDRIGRYGMVFRAARVLNLPMTENRQDTARIDALPEVESPYHQP